MSKIAHRKKGDLKVRRLVSPRIIPGSLKVWWIPQVPMKSFDVPVETLREAKLVLDVLAGYDAFQYKNNIKPDYSNAGGVQIFEGGEWSDWFSPEGEEIDDLTMEQIKTLDE